MAPVLKYWDGTQYVALSGGGGLDQGTADARYVKKAGDTVTGDLGFQAGDGTVRMIGMRAASSGNQGLRVMGDATGVLRPLSVMDPALPEHAATRGWTQSLIQALPSTPVAKTINSSTVVTVNSGTVTPVPGTTQDLVLIFGTLMLQSATAGCTWEAACVVNGAYVGGQFRQTMPTGAGSYQNLTPTGVATVTHNGSPYPVRMDCWIATGTGTTNVVADSRYNRITGLAIAVA